MTLSVASDALRIEIDPASGAITALRHLGRELALISRAVTTPPFRLELVGGDAIDRALSARVEPVDRGLRITWSLEGGIELVADVETRGPDLLWRPRVRNRGRATIGRLEFPIIGGIGRLGGPGIDELAHSHGTGMLFHDPIDLFEPDPENRRRLRRSPYPEGFAGATMQFLAYYARGVGGFFVGMEDAGRGEKWLNVDTDGSALSVSLMHKPSTLEPGADLVPDYPVVVAPLDQGSWYEAGDRYRTWALGQSWAIPGPRSRWIREQVGVCTFGVNARHDRSAWLEAVHRMAGTPVLHVLGPNWAAFGQDYQGHLPRGLGDWFPAEFDAANLATIARNGDRWAPFEFDLLCADPPDGGEPVLANRQQLDLAQAAISDGGLPGFPFMCPATSYWHDTHVARDAQLMRDHGPDAVYYDISVNNVLMQCLATNHPHAPGGGEPIVDAFATMFRDTSAAMDGAAARHVPVGAEMISELFIPSFDFYQARGESGPYAPFETGAFRDWTLTGRAEKIPLFAYVYGERAPLRMDGWAKLSAETGDAFYWTAAQVLLNGGLFELNGEFSALEDVDGRHDDPAEHYFAFEARRLTMDPAKAAFVGEVARTRVGPANHYLADGRLLPAPTVEVDTVALSYQAINMSQTEAGYDSRGTIERPAVLASAWSHHGRTAWLVASVVPEPRHVRVDGRSMTIPGRSIQMIEP